MPIHVALHYPLPPAIPPCSPRHPRPRSEIHPREGPLTLSRVEGSSRCAHSPPLSSRRPLLCPSRGSARDLGLAHSRPSLLPPFPPHSIIPNPDRESIPKKGRSPCRRSAEAEAESKGLADALIRPPVTPTPLTLSSRGSARDLGLAHSRQSLPPRPTPDPFADSPKR